MRRPRSYSLSARRPLMPSNERRSRRVLRADTQPTLAPRRNLAERIKNTF